MEGVQICYSKVHEEICSKPSMHKTSRPEASKSSKASASSSMPSWPSSSAMPSRPEASKSSKQIPHAAPAPPKSSAVPTKSSAPVHLASFQRTTGISIASGVLASSSAAQNSSAGPSLLKKKATAGRDTRPSTQKKQVVFTVPSDDDEADEEELAEIIRDRQERAAKAKGTHVPLLLDPRAILDYIDLWHKDPNTPMPDFKLTPGQSHMVTHFIQEEKWKYDRAREIRKSQYRKEKLLKKNVVKMTPEELVKMQAEIKALSDNIDSYYADWQGAKVRFVKLTDTFTKGAASRQQEVPHAEASVQETEEHASTADEVQAAEENASSRADDSTPAAEEIARASTSGAPEETKEIRATASVAPEENQPDSSAPPAPTPTPILPSALDVKNTKAAERAAVKKSKASNASESSAPKKMKQ